ncbi:MAG TPA: TonB-dependent receptor, partial [Flavobacterium sp.]|uniref:SusC/RagA family TonB-linked outer membrane protein n=1 Tax=Flavobacterium sp. TaxID=239 RepID=UPI002F3F54E8
MRNFIFSFLALILLPAYMSGQVIKGKVLDKNGVGIPGAIVVAVDSKTNADTDFDGNFEINANVGEMLKVTMLGFEATSASVTGSLMTIVMQESEDTALKEVVVIGYGTAKKRDLAGSIVRIEGKTVADKPNSNPVASLQGKVAGLSVVNSGRPGQEPDIRIRGTVSRNQTKPLYVVDGIFSNDISYINSNDIESIEILKDPSSLAIFGVRGANGVILVSTKQGKAGKLSVNFNSATGVKTIVGKPKLANATLFKQLYDEQRVNDGAPPYSFYNLFTGDTDWIDQLENKGAVVQNSNLSIQSASEANKLSLGFGYLKEDGVIRNEKFEKITFNLNDEVKIVENFKVGMGLNGIKSKLPVGNNFGSALNATPIVSPYNPDGIYNQLPSQIGGAQIGNPLIPVNEESNTKINEQYRLVGNVFAELKFFKDFTFRVGYSGDMDVRKGRSYVPLIDVYAAESNEVTPYSGRILTSVSQYNTTVQNFQQDYLLTYNKKFGEHSITALAGYNSYQEYLESISGSVTQNKGGEPIPNDPRWWYLNVFPYGDQETRISNSEQWERATTSNLFRVLYNYQGKYIVNGSFRRDSSSELPKDTRDQNFWSIGAAWEVGKEKFMETSGINSLKIKGSYGELGNQYNAVHYPYLPNYTTGASAVFGSTLVPAFVLAYRNTDNLKWETVTSYEGGFELTTFKNRLKLDATYYNKTTKDLLVFVEQGNERFYTNAGEIENKGFEFSASWDEKVSDRFAYSFSGNMTTLNNKVNSVFEPGYEIFQGPTRTSAGDPIGSFYGYEVEGIYQSYADVLASPISTLGSYGPGDFKYRDINGDGKVTTDDRKVIGNPTPDFTYGLSTSATYSNFSLAIDLQGVYGNEIWRNWGNGSTFAQFNYREAREDRWTGPGTSNWEPRLSEASGYNKLNSTYNVEDCSYIRIRNIQLAYDFKPFSIKEVNIQTMKLYLNAQNLYTW